MRLLDRRPSSKKKKKKGSLITGQLTQLSFLPPLGKRCFLLAAIFSLSPKPHETTLEHSVGQVSDLARSSPDVGGQGPWGEKRFVRLV